MVFHSRSGIKEDKEFPCGLSLAKVLSRAVLPSLTGMLFLPLSFPSAPQVCSPFLCPSWAASCTSWHFMLPHLSTLLDSVFLILQKFGLEGVWELCSTQRDRVVRSRPHWARQRECESKRVSWKPPKSQFCPLSQADLTIYSSRIHHVFFSWI